jgi:hypothetical protein
MAVDKMTADLGGYVGAPLAYLAIWTVYGAPVDVARALALALYTLHFGDPCFLMSRH